MRGRILGIEGDAGTVLGEDGSRYTFEISSWRSQDRPQPRDEVDFVVQGNQATEIYVTRGAGGAATGDSLGGTMRARVAQAEAALSRTDNTDLMAKARDVIAMRPQVLLASSVLLASFAFTWIEIGSGLGPNAAESNLVGTPDMVAEVKQQLATSVALLKDYLTTMSASGYVDAVQVANTKANLQKVSTALNALRAAPLLWLIPAGAAMALFLEYRGKRSRLLELVVGALGVATTAGLFMGRDMLARAVTNSFGTGSETVRQAIQIGPGAWIVALCGAGLIATAIGALRRTPGL